MIAKWRHIFSAARTFWSDLSSYRPRLLSGVVVLMLARSLSESVTLLSLIPLLSVAGVGLAPLETSLPTDNAAWQWMAGQAFSLEYILVFFFGVIALRSALGYANGVLSMRFLAGYVDHVRCRVYQAYSRASWLHALSSSEAKGTYALTLQTDNIDEATTYTLGLISSFLTILTGLSVALFLSPGLTLAVLASVVVLTVPLMVFQIYAYERGRLNVKAMQRLYDMLVGRIGGTKLAKAFSVERELEREFNATSRAYSDTMIEARMVSARATFVHEIGAACVLILFVILALGVFGVSNLELILLVVIFARLLPLMMSFQQGLRALAGALPEIEILWASMAAAQAEEEMLPDTVRAIGLRSQIEVREVSFAYPGQAGRPALSDVSLMVPSGSTIGIVGLSGAGKSTLLDLIAGLIAPTGGEIVVDGKVIGDVERPHWRAGMTYVPQDAPLFHDTVRANVLLGQQGLSDDEIWQCLDIVGATGLVRNLALGLDTMVGNQGSRLSGGERQRLRLASALLRKPGLLLLDEATSALHPDDERDIIVGLRKALESATIFVVAHRAASVAWTDELVVLERGRIVETGRPVDIIGRMADRK